MDFIVFCCLCLCVAFLCPRVALFCPRVAHGAISVQPRLGLLVFEAEVVVFLCLCIASFCPRVAHGATAIQPRSGLLVAILLKIICLDSKAACEAIFYRLVAVLSFYVRFDARNASG